MSEMTTREMIEWVEELKAAQQYRAALEWVRELKFRQARAIPEYRHGK